MAASQRDGYMPRPLNAFFIFRKWITHIDQALKADANAQWDPSSPRAHALCYGRIDFTMREKTADFMTRYYERLKQDKANNTRESFSKDGVVAFGDFSKYVGSLWAQRSDEDAEHFKGLQAECLVEHDWLCPDYQYKPNKRKRDDHAQEQASKRRKPRSKPSLNRTSTQDGFHSAPSPLLPARLAKRPHKKRSIPTRKTASASSSTSSSRNTKALPTRAPSVTPATPVNSRSSSLPALQPHHTAPYLPHIDHHPHGASVPLWADSPNSAYDHWHASLTSQPIPFGPQESWNFSSANIPYTYFDVEGKIAPVESTYTSWNAWQNTPSSGISSLGGSPQRLALAPAQLPFSAFTPPDETHHQAPHTSAPGNSYLNCSRLSPPSANFTHLSPGPSPHTIGPDLSATVAPPFPPLDYTQGSSTVNAGQDTFSGSAYGLDALSAFGPGTDLGIIVAHDDGNVLGLGHYSNLQPGVPFLAPETIGFDFDTETPVPGYDFDVFENSSSNFVASPFDFALASLDTSGLAFGQNMPIATLPA